MFSRGSITLFRVHSVPVRAHWTLLLIIPYLAFVFALRFAEVAKASGVAPNQLLLPPLLWGVLIAIGLFLSVALHELAHTWVAIRSGGQVREITLMLLGGVSQVERMPRQPRYEALMALAGPITSLLLGWILLGIGQLPLLPADARFGLYYLARMNIVLAFFNLLPAFPMDGGRVLRALLATRYGMARATRVAAIVGKVAALLFGVLAAFAGNFLLLLIAFFLYGGADYEAKTYQIRESLQGVRLAEIMATPAPTVPIQADFRDALDRMRRSGRRDLVVVDSSGRPVGVLVAEDLVQAPRTDLANARVVDLSRYATRAITALPDEPASAALERASDAHAQYVVVVEPSPTGDLVAGVVGPAEIANAVALRALYEKRLRERLRPRPV